MSEDCCGRKEKTFLVGADGETPSINGDGNWEIGGVDTGFPAVGSDGADGVSIDSVTDNGDFTWTVNFSDGSTQVVDITYAVYNFTNLGSGSEIVASFDPVTRDIEFRTIGGDRWIGVSSSSTEITASMDYHIPILIENPKISIDAYSGVDGSTVGGVETVGSSNSSNFAVSSTDGSMDIPNVNNVKFYWRWLSPYFAQLSYVIDLEFNTVNNTIYGTDADGSGNIYYSVAFHHHTDQAPDIDYSTDGTGITDATLMPQIEWYANSISNFMYEVYDTGGSAPEFHEFITTDKNIGEVVGGNIIKEPGGMPASIHNYWDGLTSAFDKTDLNTVFHRYIPLTYSANPYNLKIRNSVLISPYNVSSQFED